LVPGSEKAYIATQGPTASTLSDFWRMVWESNVSVILMLTKEIETGKKKCEHYWPDPDVPLEFDGLKVQCEGTPLETDELAEREFRMSMDGKDRVVRQLQYLAWPDHGIPEDTSAFLQLVKDADTWNKTKGPMIVHCSAGIGRTGTFCTVHANLSKISYLKEEKPGVEPKVNIVDTILHFRKQRPGIVQTVEQYEFCYIAINVGARAIMKGGKASDSESRSSRSSSSSSASSSRSRSGSGSSSASSKQSGSESEESSPESEKKKKEEKKVEKPSEKKKK